MVHLKVILIIAITMAVSITTLTMKTITPQEEANAEFHDKNNVPVPSKIRRSRFLAENLVTERHPSAADHCHKENEMCYLVDNGKNKNATCCNNKCVDLGYDDKNCGACKKKCKFTQTCCRGECVELAYDKRHCGFCNHRCNPGEYCVYGMCNYA